LGARPAGVVESAYLLLNALASVLGYFGLLELIKRKGGFAPEAVGLGAFLLVSFCIAGKLADGDDYAARFAETLRTAFLAPALFAILPSSSLSFGARLWCSVLPFLFWRVTLRTLPKTLNAETPLKGSDNKVQ